jgi:hypothetical protein
MDLPCAGGESLIVGGYEKSNQGAAPLVAEESGLVHAVAKVHQHSPTKEIIGDNESKVGEGRSWK